MMRSWHAKLRYPTIPMIFNKATLMSGDGKPIGSPLDCILRFSADGCALLTPLQWTLESDADICAVNFEHPDHDIYVVYNLDLGLMKSGSTVNLEPHAAGDSPCGS